MIPDPRRLLLLLGAAIAAGAINAIAGGGTLLTFPALLSAGVPPIAANATSAVSLVPGSLGALFGYRRDVESSRSLLVWIALPSLAGGCAGALVAERLGDALFGRLVPWLILAASALFLVQEPIRRRLVRSAPVVTLPLGGERVSGLGLGRAGLFTLAAFQLVVALYGGFFGGGMGVLRLAGMSLAGLADVHRMNGLKSFAAVCINGVAMVTFAIGGRVRWPLALGMAIGSTDARPIDGRRDARNARSASKADGRRGLVDRRVVVDENPDTLRRLDLLHHVLVVRSQADGEVRHGDGKAARRAVGALTAAEDESEALATGPRDQRLAAAAGAARRGSDLGTRQPEIFES